MSIQQRTTSQMVGMVLFGAALLLGALPAGAQAPPPATAPAASLATPVLDLRVARTGWGGASRADVQALLRSTGRELVRYFPGVSVEPIEVRPGVEPIVLYERNADGAIVMELAARDTYWAQYAFQFGHELCHVLCRYHKGNAANKWFEESVCEVSSLFVLRRMSETWKTDAPYPNWRSFAPALGRYAADRLAQSRLPEGMTLAAWHRQNAATLRASATDRARNRVVASALLPLFEAAPEHWAAVHDLNADPPDGPQTFEAYLQHWHDHTPTEHRAFVREIARQFEVALREGATPAAP